MKSDLHWVDGPWPEKLAIGARPRRGDWLEDEIGRGQRASSDTLLSLLTTDEEQSLDLSNEASLVRDKGMNFISFPIPDRPVPASPTELAGRLEKINARLGSGQNCFIHCRQGIGRAGRVAAC